MAKEKTYQTDIRKARKKAKRKKSLKKLAGLLVIICIAMIAALTSEKWLPKLRSVIENTKETVEKKSANIEAGEFPISIGETNSSEIYSYGEQFVLVTDTGITIYDGDGNKLKSIQHNLANPMGVPGGNMLLLYDIGGYSLIAVNEEGLIYSKTFTEKIILAETGSRDYAAIVTQTDKYASYMTVYDPKGNEAFLWSSGQRIVDVCMNSDGNGCIVSTIKANGGEIQSSITALSFMQTDPIYVIDNIPATVYDTFYCKGDTLWALCDSKLLHLGTDGSIISQYDYNTALSSAALDKSVAAVVEKSVERGSFDLTISGADSTDIFQISIDGECKHIACKDGLVYILIKGSLLVFNSSGEQMASYEVSNDYQSFVFIGDVMYVEDYNNIYKVTIE